jgi:hypothetical protein
MEWMKMVRVQLRYRKIKYLLVHFFAIFLPSLSPTLPSHGSCSHAACLPRLVVVLPLFLCRLCFLTCHHFPSISTSIFCHATPSLCDPLISGVVASCLPRLLVMSPLATLRHSMHCYFSSHPSSASCLDGCHFGSHQAPLVPLVQLVVASPLIMSTPQCLHLQSCHHLLINLSWVCHLLWLVVVSTLLMLVPLMPWA